MVVAPVKRQLIRSGAWNADWHVLDLRREAGGDWSYTICGLMLRAIEQVDEDSGKRREAECPLCIAELQEPART